MEIFLLFTLLLILKLGNGILNTLYLRNGLLKVRTGCSLYLKVSFLVFFTFWCGSFVDSCLLEQGHAVLFINPDDTCFFRSSVKLRIETQETKFFLFLDLIWLLKTPRAPPGLTLQTPQKRRRNIAAFKYHHYLTLNNPQRHLSSCFSDFIYFVFSLLKLCFRRSVLCEIKEYFTRLSRSAKEEFKAVLLFV